MSGRSILVVCGLLILGCAAPVADTDPTPVAVAPAPEPALEPGAPPTVDTGDAVAEAPPEAPGPRGAREGSEPTRKGDGEPGTPEITPEVAPRGEEGTPEAPETPETPDTPGKAKRPIAPKPAGIEQVNDRSWTVTRTLVTKWHEDPYSLGNVRENGEGWEMLGARQRPAYHLGMRNGDIVLEVNGHKLNTMPNLLAAYAACRNDQKFDVVFLRKGNRLTHHYEIR